MGKRLQVYESQTAPLVAYYKAQGKLRTVRGVGPMSAIFKNMCDIIETQIRPLAAVMGRIDAVAAARERAAAKAKAAAKATAKAEAKPPRISRQGGGENPRSRQGQAGGEEAREGSRQKAGQGRQKGRQAQGQSQEGK